MVTSLNDLVLGDDDTAVLEDPLLLHLNHLLLLLEANRHVNGEIVLWVARELEHIVNFDIVNHFLSRKIPDQRLRAE